MGNRVHVKKGDMVYVLSGKDKDKKGRVLKVFPDEMKVLVEGVNITSRHKKPRSANQQGGIIPQESPIDSSNVMFFCSRCKAPAKIGKIILENGQKARVCKRCGETIDLLKESEIE
jgi:large subunit ribosomal protein L24